MRDFFAFVFDRAAVGGDDDCGFGVCGVDEDRGSGGSLVRVDVYFYGFGGFAEDGVVVGCSCDIAGYGVDEDGGSDVAGFGIVVGADVAVAFGGRYCYAGVDIFVLSCAACGFGEAGLVWGYGGDVVQDCVGVLDGLVGVVGVSFAGYD